MGITETKRDLSWSKRQFRGGSTRPRGSHPDQLHAVETVAADFRPVKPAIAWPVRIGVAFMVLASCTAPSTVLTTQSSVGGVAPGNGFAPPDRSLAQALAETDYEYYSVEERTLAHAVCLEDLGFFVTVRGNALLYTDPGGQMAAYNEASTTCSEEIDARYPEAPPPTPQEEYDHNIQMAECLRSEGYDIPQAPTYETWLDTRLNENSWYPYTYINVAIEEWDRLNRVCPQYGIGTTR